MTGIRVGRPPRPADADEHPLRQATAGFRAIAADPSLRLLVALTSVQTLVVGGLNVLVVVVALEYLAWGDSGVGILLSAVGVGGLIGAGVTLMITVGRRLSQGFALGLLLSGAADRGGRAIEGARGRGGAVGARGTREHAGRREPVHAASAGGAGRGAGARLRCAREPDHRHDRTRQPRHPGADQRAGHPGSAGGDGIALAGGRCCFAGVASTRSTRPRLGPSANSHCCVRARSSLRFHPPRSSSWLAASSP